MTEQRLSKDGSPHVTDEVWNTVISTFGAIFALVGVVALVVSACEAKKTWSIVAFSIYGVTLFGMFLISALHHGVNGSQRVNHLLRQLDYYAVFTLIAGTFTPFCLVLFRTPVGISLFVVIWFLAGVGITFKATYPTIPKWFTNTLYVGMGWIGLAIVFPLAGSLPWHAWLLFFLGGVLYTVGSFFYYLERPNPLPGKFGFHEIWHFFVITAAACHFFVIFMYILPL